MTIEDVRAWMVVAQFLVFVGIVWWAYSGPRRSRFEADALRVLHDDDTPPQAGRSRKGANHG
ncbi:CcoQ/FixQ family Cbb3-type cytochrome c oxidase assembly chaperone [Hydrogenophaga sp.]|uniref:cbb3-type cytochrome oxidase subunit 3 n=1 Tax=Hydrogenophaga sp. TaxID=1904254 RepID=UPI0026248F72|nr:CcoQ/FixQ family Cbb3-type cytochrome c oxidase assembly chaperone [Hydrogenophaga sp.]MCW5624995.1 CcoQ/FixQ family Cbb3-type cytochrome c oxidase assembly chaperone [Burkholderiales bacterium]MCW5652877.1 CcoQ/FixQ family Cbb3-type cytochrome c oxidase assembly chaperone [Hydrogenophaga sp.]